MFNVSTPPTAHFYSLTSHPFPSQCSSSANIWTIKWWYMIVTVPNTIRQLKSWSPHKWCYRKLSATCSKMIFKHNTSYIISRHFSGKKGKPYPRQQTNNPLEVPDPLHPLPQGRRVEGPVGPVTQPLPRGGDNEAHDSQTPPATRDFGRDWSCEMHQNAEISSILESCDL